MGLNQILFKGGQIGFQTDFFILDAQFFSDIVPVEIDRAFRQVHCLCNFLCRYHLPPTGTSRSSGSGRASRRPRMADSQSANHG